MGVVLAAAGLAGLAAAQTPGSKMGSGYQEALASAKQAPLQADWRGLRFAYAGSPNFASTELKVELERDKMLTARRDHDWPELLKRSEAVVDLNFADGQGHEMASTALKSMGRDADAERELATSVAIFKSIQATDGLSAEKAMEVISVREEYELMYARQRQVTRQSLVSQNGHSYDVLTTMGKQGLALTFWFQIDRILAEEARRSPAKT